MLQLLKMQATGNDFLVLDGTKFPSPPLAQRAQMARTYCQRVYGFGADGFLILEEKSSEIHWDFYNSDGSSANMCGNAARAVALYLMQQSKTQTTEFFTNAGRVLGKMISKNSVEVQFDIPPGPASSLTSPLAILINTAVLHAVVKVPSLEEKNLLRKLGLDIKSQFQKDGINVTFYVPISEEEVESVTFERGVEDFTLACGTGALAAARVHLREKDGSCLVTVPGGKLHVTFHANRAILSGEARGIGWCRPITEDET